MRRQSIKRSLVILIGLIAVLLPTAAVATAAGASSGPAATYEIRFVNNTSGQYFTPPNVALHSNDVSVFDLREEASPGVQAVAENGAVPVLAAELAAAVDGTGNGVSGVLFNDTLDPSADNAPLAPGVSASGTFTTDEDKFSLVSMIICTNDGFAGSRAKNLPDVDGETIRYDLRGYDSGTEVNTELLSDLVPAPFCGGSGQGTFDTNPALAEDGVIRVHRTLQGVGDIPDSKDWDNNNNIAYVEITRVATDAPAPAPAPAPADDVPTYAITFVNNTTGQYFTPPNVALHSNDVSVFDIRGTATPGVQAVAENGAVPVLAAELAAAVDGTGNGVSGVLFNDTLAPGADNAPLAPGVSASGEFSTTEGKFSLVSMIICTNDGFAGSRAKNLPNGVGETVTYDLRGYDSGTEVNTELLSDLVPAPFCGGSGQGTFDTNPALAEDGVIRVHRTLQGVGDIPDSKDWDNNNNIAYVEITRID